MSTTTSTTSERRDGAGDEHSDERRSVEARAQTGAEGVAAPLAPSASRPSQSTPTDPDATTPFEPVSAEGRSVARAILSTLSPGAAACVLVAVAGLARAIVEAFDLVRDGDAMAEALAERCVDVALGAFDALADDTRDASVAAFAVSASWWFSTPHEVARSFWRGGSARASVVMQSRGALEEVETLRALLASGSLTVAPVVVRVPSLPVDVERVTLRGVTFTEAPSTTSGDAEPLAAILRDVAWIVSESGTLHGLNAELAVTLAGLHTESGTLADVAHLAARLTRVTSERFETVTDARDTMDAMDAARVFGPSRVALRLVAFVDRMARTRPETALQSIDLEGCEVSA